MGYTLGPIIGAFVAAGASQIVAQALTLTAVAFVGLSATAIITKKDFSFMSSFLTAGAFVLIGAMLLAFFMESSALHLAVSAGFRSEEHTSELQSRPHLACRLLLEKKKKHPSK